MQNLEVTATPKIEVQPAAFSRHCQKHSEDDTASRSTAQMQQTVNL